MKGIKARKREESRRKSRGNVGPGRRLACHHTVYEEPESRFERKRWHNVNIISATKRLHAVAIPPLKSRIGFRTERSTV